MTEQLLLPLPQSAEFARTFAAMGRPLRLCKRECRRRVRMLWQVQSRRFRLFGRVDLVSRGPVADNAEDLMEWAATWRHWHDGRPFVLNADGIAPQILRANGFWPLMTPATLALLDLDAPATMRQAMQQKWRNRLNRAEGADLRVIRRPLAADDWLLTAEAEQARARRYRGMPPAFATAFAAANPGLAQVFEARHRGTPVAAALMLRHGRMATWQIGHSTPEGRKLNAMNLVLWHAMEALQADGHEQIDLGILNAQDAAGLTRFKLGTGARAHQLGGTWLHLGSLAPLARLLPDRMLR
ncbi:GNAT family N-acetyltransferase [Sagittula sp. SSi028]|uniref:GNAT family N-acetyltransferase n=1 Tax=Sagittula sp. SSi028 TaxID=3400636 RepID=UPI003AF696B9